MKDYGVNVEKRYELIWDAMQWRLLACDNKVINSIAIFSNGS